MSNSTDFSFMFCKCNIIVDISPLQNLNVLNSTGFNYMFFGCNKLKELSSLKNGMFQFQMVFVGCFLIAMN